MSIAEDIINGIICEHCNDVFHIPNGMKSLNIPQHCASCHDENSEGQLSEFLTIGETLQAFTIIMKIGGFDMPFLIFDDWYVQIGGTRISRAKSILQDGIDINNIEDIDWFDWNTPIKTTQELILAIYKDGNIS